MTENQLARFGKTLAGVAGSPVEVEDIKGTIYLFGSELATLRVFMQYNRHVRNHKTNQGYSSNLEKWYFSLTIPE